MKVTKLIMCGSLVGFLAVVSVGGLLAPDRTFSDNENRELEQKPEISWESIKDGSFQENLEEYLNDQIWGRDYWISIKTAIQKTMGDTDIGGAYIGKDGYDFEKITEENVNQKLVEKNIAQLKRFFETCNEKMDASKLMFMLVPTSGLILKDKLPTNAPLFDQSAYMDRIMQELDEYHVVDVRDVLSENKDADIYYRTDHHWTSKGAFVCYQAWMADMGVEISDGDYKVTTVSDRFRGSLYSKILDFDSEYDAISFYENQKQDAEYSVFVNGEKSEGFYHYDSLEKKDKYLFFFGGNYAEVMIQNHTVQNGKNLLLIKDSFANSFAPMAAEQYDNIYMIDLRYFSGDMQTYMQEHEITDVLVLYNVSNFISDRNMHKLN